MGSTLLAHLVPALLSEVAIILGRPQTDLPITTPLDSLSFHSLSLKHFQQKLRRELGIHVPLAELKDQSIDSLAKSIISGGVLSGTDVRGAIHAQLEVDETATFDLLPMQQLYWSGRASDEPQSAWIQWETVLSSLDTEQFQTAVNRLIDRHGALRTYIMPSGEQNIEPRQSIGRFKLNCNRVYETDEELAMHRHEILEAFEHPNRASIFHIEALRYGADHEFRIFFLFDLIVADARALTILMNELWALYSNATVELPKLELTMPRYVALVQQRQNSAVQKAKEEQFWAKLCDQEPEDGGLYPYPQLPLAADPQHGEIQRYRHPLTRQNGSALRSFAARRDLRRHHCYLRAIAAS